MLIRSVTAVNIMTPKRVRFILERGIIIRLLVDLLAVILLQVRMKIRLV